MPTRTGTASQVDASLGDGSTSVTVPATANAVVALWSHWDGNALSTLSGLTLNGVSFDIRSQLSEGATTDAPGVGVATLPNPATGVQTLAWTWSAGGARSEGGELVLVYVQDANIADIYRAAGTSQGVGGANVAVTLATETTDLLLAFCESFTGNLPGLDGTVFINDAAFNSHVYDVSEVTPLATSTTVNMLNESYSGMAAISLKQAVAGKSLLLPVQFPQAILMR